jgi:hypothetical protein
MSGAEIVSKFIADLEPDDLPIEYIQAAKITDAGGNDVMITGDELAKLLSHDNKYEHVKDARIFINVQKIMQAINMEVEYIYYQVEQLLLAEEQARSK